MAPEMQEEGRGARGEAEEEAVEDEGIVRKAGEGRVGSVTFRIARTRTFLRRLPGIFSFGSLAN